MIKETKALRFIDEVIEVHFAQPPAMEKKPGCPDGFTWQGQDYHVAEVMEEWTDFSRRGRFARNMNPAHAATAARRGSWGVGRFYYRIRTQTGQIFDLYYDRAPKDADHRKGAWFLYREMNVEG